VFWTFIYLDKYKFCFKPAKVPIIVHAPSDPILKGTPLIRFVLHKLKEEGYVFDYRELTKISNDKVLEELANSHIVIDQLFGSCGGVFSLEALASGNVVLGAANPEFNHNVPRDCPTIHITPLDIYEKLKWVLEHPEEWEKIAVNGRNYVKKYHDKNVVAKQLKADMEELFLA